MDLSVLILETLTETDGKIPFLHPRSGVRVFFQKEFCPDRYLEAIYSLRLVAESVHIGSLAFAKLSGG